MLNLRENPILGPVIDRLADYASGNAGTEIAQGQRAYDCMNQITATSRESSSGPSRKKFFVEDGIMQAISYGIVYQLFDNDEDIAVICPDENMDGNSGRRAVANNNNNNIRRRAQTQEQPISMEPAYPFLDPDYVYSGFLFRNVHVDTYLESGDVNNRATIGALVDQLNSEIAVYATASENLDLASAWLGTIGEFVSTVVPEAGVAVAGLQIDFGSFLRGVSGLLSNLSSTVALNISRRQRTLAKLSNNKSLIDSAEIEAGFRNTQTLLGEISFLLRKVEDLHTRTRA